MKRKQPAKEQPESNNEEGFTRTDEEERSRPRRRTLRIRDLSSLSEDERSQLVEMVMEDGATLEAIGAAVDAVESGEGAPPAPGTITSNHIRMQLDGICFVERLTVRNAVKKQYKIDCPPEALQAFSFPDEFKDQYSQGLADLDNEYIPESWRLYMTGGQKFEPLFALGFAVYAQWDGFRKAMVEFAKTRAATAPNGKVSQPETIDEETKVQ